MVPFVEYAAGLVFRGLARIGLRPTVGLPIWTMPVDFEALGHFVEPQFEATLKIVSGNTMLTVERLISVWDQVRYLDKANVHGAIVECGVWKGGAVALMAEAHKCSGPPTRDLHLFDSFCGLPEPNGAVDGKRSVRYARFHAGGRDEPIGKCVGTLDENRHLLEARVGYPRSLLHYHAGWFSETIPAVAPQLGPLALLRIDGDWYESTRIVLEHLYPKVVHGGIVVVDDYGYWPGCRKAVDEFLGQLDCPVLLNQIDFSGRYWIKA